MLEFDPYSYAVHEDPYPVYKRLRDEAPAYWNERLGFWALSRHADVLAAFKEPLRFSSAGGVSLERPRSPIPRRSRSSSPWTRRATTVPQPGLEGVHARHRRARVPHPTLTSEYIDRFIDAPLRFHRRLLGQAADGR
jgi:cytochrome P450